MKSMSRTALVALMAVFALSALGSAPAAAEACPKQPGSKELALCVEGHEVGSDTGTESVGLESHVTKGAHSTLGIAGKGLKPPLSECTAGSGEGEFKSGKGSAEITPYFLWFKSCKMWQENKEMEHCSLPEPYSYRALRASVGPLTENLTMNTTEGIGLTTLTAECGVWSGKKTWHLGGLECKVAEPEVAKVEHEYKCEEEGVEKESDVWIENEVQFSLDETVELSGPKKGQKFSIIESP